ncbi:S-layer homology domain-containing protein [Bacillus badius]|uniref:S-layer homology domain-containing protein n=1 Tax=Bacillus badius TaxID=1455 RepID=UPI0007B387DF|nr:S-layer homology domain-containing protein [Bacillus badius]KZR59335.1 hypothetical protein A3781_13115 [Bacillus badius]
MKKKILSALIVGGMLFSPAFQTVEATGITITTPATSKYATPTFKDVKKDYWAYTEIEWAYEKGIIDGIGDGRFSPSQTITEAQFTKIIVQYLDLKAPKKMNLPSHWANPYYEAMIPQKTVLSTTNRGQWSKPITRGKVAQTLGKILNGNGELKSSIDFLYSKGLTNGQNINGDKYAKYNPNGKLTRAEAVAFVKRMFDNKIGGSKIPVTSNETLKKIEKFYSGYELVDTGENSFIAKKNGTVVHANSGKVFMITDYSDNSVDIASKVIKELGHPYSQTEIKNKILNAKKGVNTQQGNIHFYQTSGTITIKW